MNDTETNDLSKLEPQQLWQNFAAICQIPHPSKKEAKITKFMKEFGESLNLETIIDEVGNVIIRKPATKGMENRKGIILQAHLDMVPQKNRDIEHNFETDPIQAYIDGEWVRAKGTTLGSDNGIGVAAVMAILQDESLVHGSIEALFTVDEETGMTGAIALKPNLLQGDILANLDSEDEGEFFIGCAGGGYTDAKLKYSEVPTPKNVIAFKVNVSGLKGGHSGCDIHLGRGNSNKILNRLLWQASESYGLRLAKFDGGSLPNAIPREAFAIVTVPKTKENEFIEFVKEFAAIIKQEFATTDPNVTITAEKTDLPKVVMDEAAQNDLLNAIYSCFNGVMGMSADVPGLVETSTNLGRINAEKGEVEILTLQRSSVESKNQDASNTVKCAFELAGAKVKQHGFYTGWNPNIDSAILDLCKKVYAEKYGKEPVVTAIHAGLECGLLGHTYPNLDMISFGPTIKNAHSPDEKVNIATVAKFWDFLIEILKNIPAGKKHD